MMYRIMNLLKGVLVLGTIPLFYISGLIPRKKNIWLFSAWQGNKYRGKVRYFYEYMADKHSDQIEAVWITNNSKVKERIRKDGNIVYKMYSWQGIKVQLLASCYFVSHGPVDFLAFLSRNAKVIKLGHSTYPIKKAGVGNLLMTFGLIKRFYLKVAMPYSYWFKNLISHEVSSSEESGKYSTTRSQNPDLEILPFGSTKAGYMQSLSVDKDQVLEDILGVRDLPCDQIISFFPTWRTGEIFSIFHHGFDQRRLQERLEQTNSILVVSFHPYDAYKRKKSFPSCARVILFEPKGDELDRVLAVTNTFVTDFSSLFADYLIFDRPLVFAQFCRDDYVKENMDIELPSDDLPGPVAESWQQLENKLFDSVEWNGRYAAKRAEWIERVYGDRSTSANDQISNYFFKLDNIV